MRKPTSFVVLLVVMSCLPAANTLDQLQAAPLVQDVSVVPPDRILDTRLGIGAPAALVTPGETLVLPVPVASNAGASSVTLNLTSTQAAEAGWAKVWPCGDPVPATSALNFTAGRDVANAVISRLPAEGICITTSVPVHLIADVSAWSTGTDDFVGTRPERLLDTRTTGTPLQPFVERQLVVAGTPGVDSAATIAALNLTVDRPAAAGYIAAYPCGQRTDGSTVNFSAGEQVANLTVVALGGGSVCFTSSVDTEFIVDSYGWSVGNGRLEVQNPQRVLDTRNPAIWPAGIAESTSTLALRVAGRGGVPNDADSALVTLTVTNATDDGYVTMWPCDEPFPVASTINTWPTGQRSNLATVKLSQTDGTACIRYIGNSNGPTHLIVDAVGWISGGPGDRAAPTGPGTVTPGPGSGGGGGGATGTATSFVPPTQPAQFVEDFSAVGGFYSRFQTQIFHGTGQLPTDITMWHGDHNGACQGPTTLRDVHVDNPAEMFWHCAPAGPDSGHVMTSMYTTGYAQVNFSPNETFTDINRVCWDQNQTEMGGRKWTQVVVVPESTYAANGFQLNYIKPPLQNDVAVNGIRIDGSTFLFDMLRGSTTTFVGQGLVDQNVLGFTTTDKARRFKTCITDLGNGNVRIELERAVGIEVRTLRGALPDGRVRVIFQDDSYDPPKDAASNNTLTTWHWDNIDIS